MLYDFLLRTWVGGMGALVILRWRASDFECELQIAGTAGKVWIRQQGRNVRSTRVTSASAAHQWAEEAIHILEGRSDGPANPGAVGQP